MPLAALSLAVAFVLVQARETTSPAADPVQKQLEAIRLKAKLPALGGAIVTTDGLEAAWVGGVRANGHEEKVEVGDAWHLGSCTKSMTATLIALLAEEGKLEWDAPLVELLPE